MASFESLKALFGSRSYVVQRGVDLVVAESNVYYHGACRFDEELSVDTYVERVGNTSLVLRFDVLRDGELVTKELYSGFGLFKAVDQSISPFTCTIARAGRKAPQSLDRLE